MTTTDPNDARQQARRWLEGGQPVLGVLLSVVDDYDRLSDRVNAAVRENERLRASVVENEHLRQRLLLAERQCERLREELGEHRAELERSWREREVVADQFTQVMNDILLRLRSREAAGVSVAGSL